MTKGKTDSKGTGKLTIKISKSAFKAVPTTQPVLKFKMLVEGVEKEFTVNITVS